MTSENKGMLLGLIAVSMFGLTLPTTRFISPYLDPIFIGLGRATLAALIAATILFLTKQTKPDLSQIKQLTIVALGVVIGFPVLSAWAMQSLPASHGGVVLGILPLATAAASRLVSNERPSAGFWLLSSMGSILVVAYSLLEGGGSFMLGDLALFGAVISAAFGYAVGGTLSKELGGWQVICWALVLSFPFTLIPTLNFAPSNISELPLSIHISFLYLTLASQLFGFFIWYKAMAIGGVARVSQAQLLQPFITILASAFFLSEIISIQTYAFATVVVFLVTIGKNMPVNKHTH